MTYFNYNKQRLYAEKVNLTHLAHEYGTPTYVYSKAAILDKFNQYTSGLSQQNHLVCYAIKANSNLAILNSLSKQGSGFDVVSGGELARCIKAGADPQKIVFSGVGKSVVEIRQALAANIYCFNVESSQELQRISVLATEMKISAPIALRVNPNVDANTHPYISTGLNEHKFGIAYDEVLDIYQLATTLPNIKITGISCHIGSQLNQTAPFVDAIQHVLALVEQLQQNTIMLEHIDIGGGLGINYGEEPMPSIADYTTAIKQALGNTNLKVIIEPGRSLVADAGILLTRVEYIKNNNKKAFVIVDAAMNDLLRPSLYQAQHRIISVDGTNDYPQIAYDVVGPICESSDCFAKNYKLQIVQGDLLAILDVGAYGFGMSSNYNSRGRAAEILVDGDVAYLVRQRESVDELWQLESIPNQSL